MVIALAKEPSTRLLKHVIRCYSRLSDNNRYGWFQLIRQHRFGDGPL